MTVTLAPLDYYARIGAALFPILAGSKSPVGIVESFAHDYSTNPAQWHAWRAAHPGCNFGLVAGPSRIITADVDVSEIGRERAWLLWCEWWQSIGQPVPTPHVQSARGGWHTHFALPADVDVSTLHQVALIGKQPGFKKAVVDLRVGNGFTVAAGSYYDGTSKGEESGAYVLMSDAPPYPAPAALIEHCTRTVRATASPGVIGSRDKGDVAALLNWMHERDAFASYEDWLNAGMAMKLEFGDDGLELWELTFDETVTPDVRDSKWQSFATEPGPGAVTINTLLSAAHKMGWRGQVRRSTASLFDGVAALAAAAGATLASGAPVPQQSPSNAMPMMAGQEVLCTEATPILQEFLTATIDAPARPISDDFPTLPDTMAGHGLYPLMQDCITRIIAMAEPPQKWNARRVTAPLSVLTVVHPDVFDAVRRRLEAHGRSLDSREIKLRAKALENRVQRAFVKQDDWIFDPKGLPESDNPDNVATFLGIIGAEMRWNSWLNRAEIRGFEWSQWTPLDDLALSKMKTRAKETGTRFKPADTFFNETLLTIADKSRHDPVVEFIAELQAEWDGTPRLLTWLSAACGVPCDPYHQAVSRNVIGGIVKRARRPGVKHDEVLILMGPQGTAKSTLCRILAMKDEWFTDSVSFDGSPQNVVPQLFGKLVVELAELDGMARKEVNYVKRFITAQSDNVTLKYRAFASDFPRRCVFIGTSNEHSPLVDATGNRRFLPVRVTGEINTDWLRANIRQIVAEAAHREAAGESFAIPREVWGEAAEHQEAARGRTDMEVLLAEWFAMTTHTAVAYVTAKDLTDLCMIAGWRNAQNQHAAIMRKLGFRSETPRVGGERGRVWFRGPPTLPKHIEQCTRYVVSKAPDGLPRVTLRIGADIASPSQVVPPPAPSR